MVSDLLLCSHFDKKLLKIVKNFSSFIFMPDLVGKLDWLFSLVSKQILYRAISDLKCFKLQLHKRFIGHDSFQTR